MNIPKAGSELLPGHHFFFENILKLLKLLTFSQTNEETVDKIVDTFHQRMTEPKAHLEIPEGDLTLMREYAENSTENNDEPMVMV